MFAQRKSQSTNMSNIWWCSVSSLGILIFFCFFGLFPIVCSFSFSFSLSLRLFISSPSSSKCCYVFEIKANCYVNGIDRYTFVSFSWLKFTSGSVQWRQWREGTFTPLDFLSRIDFEFSARNDTDQISLMTTRVSLARCLLTQIKLCTSEHLPVQYILSKSANFYELWPSTFIKNHYWSTFIIEP